MCHAHAHMYRTYLNHIASQRNGTIWLLAWGQRYWSSFELQRWCVWNWELKSTKCVPIAINPLWYYVTCSHSHIMQNKSYYNSSGLLLIIWNFLDETHATQARNSWRIIVINAYLPNLNFCFSSVCKSCRVCHASRFFRNASDVASIITISGSFPHCLCSNKVQCNVNHCHGSY